MKKRSLIIIIIALVIIGVAYALVVSTRMVETTNTTTQRNANTTSAYGTTNSLNRNSPTPTMTNDPQLEKLAASPTAVVTTNLGSFTIRFYRSDAPELSKNFLELAKKGYYTNTIFHRIVPGFVIQGGDPTGTGTGGESYTGEGLGDEQGALALRHLKGAVAWAKSSLPNSIGSQFYVALEPLAQLDGSYSVFGQVVEGIEVVEAIAAVAVDGSSKPLTPVTITSVTVTE